MAISDILYQFISVFYVLAAIIILFELYVVYCLLKKKSIKWQIAPTIVIAADVILLLIILFFGSIQSDLANRLTLISVIIALVVLTIDSWLETKRNQDIEDIKSQLNRIEAALNPSGQEYQSPQDSIQMPEISESHTDGAGSILTNEKQ